MSFFRIFIILILTSLLNKLNCKTFLYPIIYDKPNNFIYLVCQKKICNLELWIWKLDSNSMQKVLSSNFLPGGIKLLPDNSGFSFIDQGKLRIKYLNKRSPKTINFYEPICDISLIEWIDNERCYFSARRIGNFAILEININDGKVKTIVENKNDCIYPQKIASSLFYVERTMDALYKTPKYFYKIIKRNYYNDSNQKVILDANSNAISFLQMISEKEGFYVEHPNYQEELINFKYHHIFEQNDIWKDVELFSFILPRKYIFGSNKFRLFESILPFLPRICDKKIFFCSCPFNMFKDKKINKFIDIYIYEIENSKIKKVTNASKNQIFYSPLIFNKKIYFGSTLNKMSLLKEINSTMMHSIDFNV